ncbi:MAG: hypothetical protein O7B79_09835 [SAR324 cluster bacterium]|nr:hypothetical protein [SAR324 cluster bacterium]
MLASCTAPQLNFVQTTIDLPAYRSFLVPRPLLPFRATGSLRFTYAGEAQAGEFILFGSPLRAYRMQLLAPVTGALALELRFDRERMLLLDFARDSYFLGGNTRENRERWIDLDITPAEFLLMVSGRISEADFAAAGGRWISGKQAQMTVGSVTYTFWLDGHGLPARWNKMEHGQLLYRVEYREYLSVPTASGPPLRLPRKLRVYTGEGAPTMILGVREFLPGARSLNPVAFVPPAGREWRFTPLPSR